MELQDSIVAILNQSNKIIGTGFVAGETWVLTCAHVVHTVTDGRDDQVRLRFAVDKAEVVADVVRFSPAYEQDVALL